MFAKTKDLFDAFGFSLAGASFFFLHLHIATQFRQARKSSVPTGRGAAGLGGSRMGRHLNYILSLGIGMCMGHAYSETMWKCDATVFSMMPAIRFAPHYLRILHLLLSVVRTLRCYCGLETSVSV